MNTLFWVCCLILLTEAIAKNVAIPSPGTACKKAITFPITKISGIQGYPWKMEVFGIPILATEKFKKSGKMNHAASVMAALLDNDNDGCADDPNVLRHLLKKENSFLYPGYKYRKSVSLQDEMGTPKFPGVGEKIGYNSEQGSDLQDVQPKFSGTNAKGNSTASIYDATIEEWLHFITDHGLAKAYPKIFGTKYSSNSTLTNAMDIARGGKLKATPKKISDYPAGAWYTYTDQSCTYDCQAGEYLWWGYAAFTGIGNPIAVAKAKEFAFLRKDDFLEMDIDLAKIFEDSVNMISSYRLPTKVVNGKYTGCKKCANGGKSHGGN